MLVQYTGKSLEIYNKVSEIMRGGKGYYDCNHIYKLNDSRYVYVNSRGYLHALIPTKITYDGNFAYYSITDYVLTRDDGALRVSKELGNYKTREETINAILNWFN